MDRGTSTIRVVKHLEQALPSEGLLEAAMVEPRDEHDHATWGVIQGLSLSSLLQMLNMERKTCTIRVTSGRRAGFFYLREGQLINARYRGKEGMDAVQELIGAAAPKMEIDGQLHDPTQQIDLRLEEILMQTAQLQDEAALAVPAGSALERAEESDAIPVSEIGKWREPASPRPHRTASRRHRHLWIGLVMLVVLAAAGWLLLPRTAALEVLSTPLGATVDLNGSAVGMTPLRLDLSGHPQGTLTLNRPGYRPLAYALRPTDRTLNLMLVALPVPAPAAPPEPAEPPPPTQVKVATSKAKPVPRKEAPAPARSDIFDQLRKQQD